MLIIKKDKIISTGYSLTKEREINLDNLIEHLTETIMRVEEDVTFGDFISLLIKARNEIDWIFGHTTGFARFTPYLDEMLASEQYEQYRNGTFVKDEDEYMEYLEVMWLCIISQDKELELDPSFHGWGKWEDGSYGGYAIELSSMGTLAPFPFKLNEDVKVWDDVEMKYIHEWTRKFTLLDVIHAILFEISFFGLPGDRDKKSAELDVMVDEIKNRKGGDVAVSENGGVTFLDINTILERELEDDGTQIHPTDSSDAPDATEADARSEPEDD